MVGNDMPSAPAFRAAYSILPATSVSFTPGRIARERRPEQARPQDRSRPNALNLFGLLDHARLLDQRAGGAQPDARGQRREPPALRDASSAHSPCPVRAVSLPAVPGDATAIHSPTATSKPLREITTRAPRTSARAWIA